MGLCVFSLPIFLIMLLRIRILYLIIIIKSEVWHVCHCLGLGHETKGMRCISFNILMDKYIKHFRRNCPHVNTTKCSISECWCNNGFVPSDRNPLYGPMLTQFCDAIRRLKILFNLVNAASTWYLLKISLFGLIMPYLIGEQVDGFLIESDKTTSIYNVSTRVLSKK